jgi:acetyl esterase
MPEFDEDAARIVAVLSASGLPPIESQTPAQIRAAYRNFPHPQGRDMAEIRAIDIPGPLGPIPARLYRPSVETARPLLVWYHGGGMVIGDLESADWVCRELAHLADTAVLSIDYRLGPEHKFPAAVEDAHAGAQFAIAHAADFGADPGCVVVGGDSAGGTCAAVACILARERGGAMPRAQLLVYPGTDRDLTRPSVTEFANGPVLTKAAMLWFRGHYHSDLAELQDYRANPALAPHHRGLPPAFVLTAEIDPIRDAGENYGNLLAHAGVMTTMKRYNGVFHGFFTMGPIMRKTTEAVADAAAWLRVQNGVET